jgi:hypothetical protein
MVMAEYLAGQPIMFRIITIRIPWNERLIDRNGKNVNGSRFTELFVMGKD